MAEIEARRDRTEVDLMMGIPKPLVESIVLLDARAIQRSRHKQHREGLPMQSAFRLWRRQFYSRVRLRVHVLHKDIKRRQEQADA